MKIRALPLVAFTEGDLPTARLRMAAHLREFKSGNYVAPSRCADRAQSAAVSNETEKSPPTPPIDDGRRAERLAACEDCPHFLELDYATPVCKLIVNAQRRPCAPQYEAYLNGEIPLPVGLSNY